MFSYTVTGSGTPVVFIHGFMESVEMWNDVKQIKGIRAICVDLNGHGGSQIRNDKSTMAEQAAEILRLIDVIEEPTVQVVGHSLGGYVALEMFKQAPQKVEHVTLLHSQPWSDSEERKKDRERVAELVLTKASTFIREAIPNLFYSPEDQQQAVEQYIETALKMEPRAISLTSLAMKDRADNAPLMEQNPDRFTFIQGKFDPLIPYSKISRFTSDANISLMVLENSAHMGQVEETEKCKELLETILVE